MEANISSLTLASIRGPLLLIDHMILCVAHCCEETDEVVQMLILNTLHILTSVYCKVNDISLILIMRVFMHIYLCSRNAVTRATAKSYTIQLLDATNLKMEESYANHVKDQVMDEAASRCEKMNLLLLFPRHRHRRRHRERMKLRVEEESIEGKLDDGRQSQSSMGPQDDVAYTNSLSLFEVLCRWTTESPAENTIMLGSTPTKMTDHQSQMSRLQALEILKNGLSKAGACISDAQALHRSDSCLTVQCFTRNMYVP